MTSPRPLHSRWLIPCALLITIVQNLFGVALLFQGGDFVLYRYDGPVVVKIFKDLLFVLLILLSLKHGWHRRQLPLTPTSAAFVLLSLSLAVVTGLAEDPLSAAVGLRWIMPFILFLTMKEWSRTIDYAAGVRWLALGMLACFTLQLLQLGLMNPVFGQLIPGIAARVPGFFVAPNSTSFFAASCVACCMVFQPHRRSLHAWLLALAVLIAALTQSGTGIVSICMLIFRFFFSRQRPLFWIFGAMIILLVFPNLNLLLMRDNYLALSGGGRLDALWSIAQESALSITSFGTFTNTANLLSADPSQQMAPDSLIASWIGNFGFFAVLATLLVIRFVVFNMRDIDWSRAMPCVLVLLSFSMTTVIFEAFPMNLLLALGIWGARKASAQAQPTTRIL